jgi:hypothetical protein
MLQGNAEFKLTKVSVKVLYINNLYYLKASLTGAEGSSNYCSAFLTKQSIRAQAA